MTTPQMVFGTAPTIESRHLRVTNALGSGQFGRNTEGEPPDGRFILDSFLPLHAVVARTVSATTARSEL